MTKAVQKKARAGKRLRVPDTFYTHPSGQIIVNEHDPDRRWSAPNPFAPVMHDARYRARYPQPGHEPNYHVAGQADLLAYLLSDDLTTGAAIEKLRVLRRAVAAYEPPEEP